MNDDGMPFLLKFGFVILSAVLIAILLMFLAWILFT